MKLQRAGQWLLPLIALGLPLTGAQPRWKVSAQPGLAGVGVPVSCSGARCPANPPEVGPDCWWYSYVLIAPAPGDMAAHLNGDVSVRKPPAVRGSVGRLACERAGPHYFAAMNGLKLEVAAGSPPAGLIDPKPLPVAAPGAAAELLPPSATGSLRAAPLIALALLLMVPLLWPALLRGRIILLAWRYQRRRELANGQSTPGVRRRDATLLDALARLVRRRLAGTRQTGLRFHLRNLDLARFGGEPLHPGTARFLRRGCR